MNRKIQVLRGWAILAVVLIHTYREGLGDILLRPFITFAVAMFLFLLGYLTKAEISDIKGFYAKRLLRVVIPYLLWSVIYTAAYGNYHVFIRGIITGRCCFAFYYIVVYIQFVLLTPLIGKLVLSKYNWIGWLITPVFVIGVYYVAKVLNISLPFPFPSSNFLVWFVFYYLGMMLGNGKLQYKLSLKTTLIFYAAGIFISEAEGIFWYCAQDYEMAVSQLKLTSVIVSFVTALLGYIYLTKGDFKENRFNRAMASLGDCSFGIYLSHILIIYFMSKLPFYNLLPFPLSSAAIALVSYGFVFAAEKNCGKKLSPYLGMR